MNPENPTEVVGDMKPHDQLAMSIGLAFIAGLVVILMISCGKSKKTEDAPPPAAPPVHDNTHDGGPIREESPAPTPPPSTTGEISPADPSTTPVAAAAVDAPPAP